MKYYVDEEQVTQEVFNQRLEEEIRNYVEDNYDDILDEIYPEVKLGNLTFYASAVIKELDPIAYNCGIDDEVDHYLSDSKYEFEREDEQSYNGVWFRTEEEDE